MDTPMIRLLRAEEIECRVSMISEKGLSLLLFKDARVDQKILDETFTPLGWKRTHQEIGGNLYCTVEIWDGEKEQWISKQDVGTESYSEKEKGQASDSFKRACFNWGIGRELYTAPFIWVPAARTVIEPRGDKYYCRDHFTVAEIAYDENRIICALSIVNGSGAVVYSLHQLKNGTAGEETAKKGTARKRTARSGVPLGPADSEEPAGTKTAAGGIGLSLEKTAEMEQELKRTGVPIQTVLERYQIPSLEQMTEEIYDSAMRSLRKTPGKNRKAA
ncbi:MAG: hypothetical protein LIP10_12255 [Clostridiales bacterium]|nr:hypothetical protein [Clostridiales bacterium]